jgi:multisubunit Na+/H+ antiporter MnhG subunit
LAVNVQNVVADIFLALAVLVVLASSIGIFLMRSPYEKVHFVAPISIVAPVLVAVAVTVRQGYEEPTGQTWLAVAILAVASSVLAHATVRAARIRETGDWRAADAAKTPTEREEP